MSGAALDTRLARLRAAMAGAGCDAFFSVNYPDNQYLTGFIDAAGFLETTSLLVVTAGEAHFLCDGRYAEQVRAEVTGWTVEEVRGGLTEPGGARLRKLGAKRAAFAPSGISVAEHGEVRDAFGGETVPVPELMAGLRRRKDPAEVALIGEASALAEGVLADLLPELRAGVTEREVAARFEYEFKRRGASGASFDTIALFGARSSLPHGMPGDKPLELGDIVLLDFGCRKSGYCSDLTRTCVYDRIPGAWFERIYAVALEAQEAALAAVRPGMSGRELDAVARDIIARAGYDDQFSHGLGHGVGIDIHEAPRLSPRSDTVLEEGMVVTIEPGIYLPGRGGVRIEDFVVVTRTGCEVLSKASKRLKII